MSYVLPIKYITETFPSTYAFSVVIYVEEGGNPIPTEGKDHMAFVDYNFTGKNTPVTFPDTILMEVVGPASACL